MKAVLRSIRISSRKANLVAGMVRGKRGEEALEMLQLMPKKGAAILRKVVQSALSNAQNNFKQPIQDLFITRILVTQGPTYKRSLPISRGRAHPIRKRTAHILVEVGLKEVPQKPQPKAVTSQLQQKPKAAPKAKTTPSASAKAKKPSPAKPAAKKSTKKP